MRPLLYPQHSLNAAAILPSQLVAIAEAAKANASRDHVQCVHFAVENLRPDRRGAEMELLLQFRNEASALSSRPSAQTSKTVTIDAHVGFCVPAQNGDGLLHLLSRIGDFRNGAVIEILRRHPILCPGPDAADRERACALLNQRDAARRTPLLVAAESRASSVATELIEHRLVAVTAADSQGNTALHSERDAKLLARLIRRGVAVNARNAAGHPPLAFVESSACAQVFLSKSNNSQIFHQQCTMQALNGSSSERQAGRTSADQARRRHARGLDSLASLGGESVEEREVQLHYRARGAAERLSERKVSCGADEDRFSIRHNATAAAERVRIGIINAQPAAGARNAAPFAPASVLRPGP